jgi:acyl-CoA dehydrogenase
MVAFDPTEEQKLIQDTVAELAKQTLLARAREFEKARGVASDVQRTAHEMGLGAAPVPEALGGQGLGMLTAVLINEELASGDAAAVFALPGFGPFVFAVQELATAEQAKALLEPVLDAAAEPRFGAVAWSEPSPNRERAGFSTVAVRARDGWDLTGKKCFVGGAERADRFVVFAQVDAAAGWNGIGAFVVERTNPGLRLGQRHDTLGLWAADFWELELGGARVEAGARLEGGGDFTAALLRFFARYSLTVAARQVGLARTAFEIAREYCDIRRAFGKPIGHFQAVAFTLADRHMDAESARELCRRAAWAWDVNKPEKTALAWTAQAVATAHEAAMRCANDSVQLHGGAGFMRDVIVEKLMRDTKTMALAGATAEQMDQLAAALDLGAPLDPALILPTPDAQAVFT